HRKGGERAVGGKIGSQQDGRRRDALLLEDEMEQGGRYVQYRNRVASQGQRRSQALDIQRIDGDGEVAGLSPRGGVPLGQVDREPLLEISRPGGGDQRWPRLATAEIDQQP